MKYVYVKALTSVLLFGCVMAALLTLQDHVIYYQEQHSLFLYTRAYMEHTLHMDGLMGYLGAFMVQFYHVPWLGAGMVALLLTGVYLLTEGIILRVTGRRDLLQLGVAGAVGLYFTLDGIEESPAWALVAFCGLGVIRLLSLLLRKRDMVRKPLTKTQLMVALVLPVVYIYGGYWIEMSGYNRSERSMIRAERAIKQKDWDAAIEITEQYLLTGRNNKLMLYLRSIALAEKGELVKRLFDVPQKAGMQALAFPWNRDSREAEYGHLVHEVTGDINAAHHWAFEAMTCWGETAPHLYDLARYNVALGRPKVAMKFADKLGQSLFYSEEAESIRRQVRGEEPCELRSLRPDSIIIPWVNVVDFRPNLMQNYNADTTNVITRQYLMASMLLGNTLRDLIPMLRPEDLEIRNIKEAVLIYSLDPQATPLGTYGLAVDEATGQDFAPFYNLLMRHDGSQLEARYGKGFWFYVHVLKQNEKK